MMVAFIRSYLNRPSRTDVNPNYTRRERFLRFAERSNVEVAGTIAYMTTIYGVMDGFANLAERSWLSTKRMINKLGFHHEGKNLLEGHAQADQIKAIVNQTLTDFYGQYDALEKGTKAPKTVKSVLESEIFTPLFKQKLDTTAHNVAQALEKNLENLGNFAHKTEIIEHVAHHAEQFSQSIRRTAAGTWLAGALGGALMGGIIWQLWNDRVFSPHVAPAVADWFGYKVEPGASRTLRQKKVATYAAQWGGNPALKDFSVPYHGMLQPQGLSPNLYNRNPLTNPPSKPITSAQPYPVFRSNGQSLTL